MQCLGMDHRRVSMQSLLVIIKTTMNIFTDFASDLPK